MSGTAKKALETFIRRLFISRVSFEDISKLLETLMIVSALLLSFTIAGLQSLDHDMLLDADQRWLKAYPAGWDSKDRSDTVRWIIPSIRSMITLYYSIGIFVVILASSTAMYTCLIYSRARGDANYLSKWFAVMRIVVFGNYIAAIVGLNYLMISTHKYVDINFPLYHINDLCVGANENSTCVYDTQTFEMKELADCDKKHGRSKCTPWIYILHQVMSQNINHRIVLIYALLVGLVFVLDFSVRFQNAFCDTESIRQLQQDHDSILTTYRETFETERITAEQYTTLTLDDLRNIICMPLGDALRFQDASRRLAESTH